LSKPITYSSVIEVFVKFPVIPQRLLYLLIWVQPKNHSPRCHYLITSFCCYINSNTCTGKIKMLKKKSLNLRLSDRRLNILREYAVLTDKTMTGVIEDFIDSLPNAKIGNSSVIPLPVNSGDLN
jgi:hypothetical protein